MTNKFEGKAAFVTGGSRGIGRGICEAFLEKGMKVCVSDVNVPVGEKTLSELQSKYGKENVMFLKCDVSCENEFEESIQTAKRKFGHLDILINNAAIIHESYWEKTIDINLKGVMRGTMLAFKYLADKDGKQGGTVISTGSVATFAPEPLLPAYTASKFAVGAWTSCWGDEGNVKRTNVKVAAVLPGATDTDLKFDVISNSVETTKSKALIDGLADNLMTTADIANGFLKVLEEEVSGVLLYVSRKKETGVVEMKYLDKAMYSP